MTHLDSAWLILYSPNKKDRVNCEYQSLVQMRTSQKLTALQSNTNSNCFDLHKVYVQNSRIDFESVTNILEYSGMTQFIKYCFQFSFVRLQCILVVSSFWCCRGGNERPTYSHTDRWRFATCIYTNLLLKANRNEFFHPSRYFSTGSSRSSLVSEWKKTSIVYVYFFFILFLVVFNVIFIIFVRIISITVMNWSSSVKSVNLNLISCSVIINLSIELTTLCNFPKMHHFQINSHLLNHSFNQKLIQWSNLKIKLAPFNQITEQKKKLSGSNLLISFN